MDYSAIDEPLTFEAGARLGTNDEECFIFVPMEDALIEKTETVSLTASSNTQELVFSMDGNSSSISIMDDG